MWGDSSMSRRVENDQHGAFSFDSIFIVPPLEPKHVEASSTNFDLKFIDFC
jgi:hypothetical protein